MLDDMVVRLLKGTSVCDMEDGVPPARQPETSCGARVRRSQDSAPLDSRWSTASASMSVARDRYSVSGDSAPAYAGATATTRGTGPCRSDDHVRLTTSRIPSPQRPPAPQRVAALRVSGWSPPNTVVSTPTE